MKDTTNVKFNYNIEKEKMKDHAKNNNEPGFSINDNQKEKHSEYWNDVLVQASIAAMQGLQESGHLLSVAADVLPKELAELSVKIAKCLVSKLKEEIGE